MKAELKINFSRRDKKADSSRFSCSPPATSRGSSGFRFGFGGGPDGDDGVRVGETRYFRVALNWSGRGPVANEEGLREPQTQTTTDAAAPAVMSITVLGDGMGKAKEGPTDVARSLRSEPRSVGPPENLSGRAFLLALSIASGLLHCPPAAPRADSSDFVGHRLR
jgi:hypothetical protein